MKTINYSLLWTSRPSTEFVWLEWPEIQQVVIRHPVVCVIIGLILLLIIWCSLKKLILSATRPR